MDYLRRKHMNRERKGVGYEKIYKKNISDRKNSNNKSNNHNNFTQLQNLYIYNITIGGKYYLMQLISLELAPLDQQVNM
jgi:hypothetical protein